MVPCGDHKSLNLMFSVQFANYKANQGSSEQLQETRVFRVRPGARKSEHLLFAYHTSRHFIKTCQIVR